jgi:hypothetical protein
MAPVFRGRRPPAGANVLPFPMASGTFAGLRSPAGSLARLRSWIDAASGRKKAQATATGCRRLGGARPAAGGDVDSSNDLDVKNSC